MSSRLPKNLRFKIGLDLPLSDLYSLSLVTKKFWEAYGDDSFWKLKLMHEYGKYDVQREEKPATMSYRVLYMRLRMSANIWEMDERMNKHLDYIYKYICGHSVEFYITVLGKLYINQSVDDLSGQAMCLDLFGKLPESKPSQTFPINIMDNVDSLAVSVLSVYDFGVLILDLNHNMMIRGSYLNGLKHHQMDLNQSFSIRSNIREIGCSRASQFYYFITDSNVLYIFDGETQDAMIEPAKPILIAENVRQVSLLTRDVSGCDLTTLYYTDNSEFLLHKLSADVYKNENDFVSGKNITDHVGYEDFDKDSEDEYEDIEDSNLNLYDIFEKWDHAVRINQNDLRNGDYFVSRQVTQLGIRDVRNFAAGKKHLFIVDGDNNLYAYDRKGNRTLIEIVRPIRKIICDDLLTAYIDVVDDLYVMGETSLALVIKNMPFNYTLVPVFMEHNVLDVVMFVPRFFISKKEEPHMFK